MRLTRRSALGRLLPHYSSANLTYPEVGATQAVQASPGTQGPLPEGYHHVRRRTRLGDGADVFVRAGQALVTWQMHRTSGLAVAGPDDAVADRTVLCGFGRPVCVVIPCRVVYVVDTPDRRGFGYGTLPGHPESGEESFVVSQDQAGGVWLDIIAFSRPGSRLNALTAPIDRQFQNYVLGRYERAVGELARP